MIEASDFETEWSHRLNMDVRVIEIADRFFVYIEGVFQGIYHDLARVDDELKMVEETV